MIPVNVSEAAQRDLDDIWLYIAKDSPANADSFIDRLIDTATKVLSVIPRGGRICEELGEGIRSFPVESYIVFYKEADSSVDIVRILHGARDLGAAFH
jgi:toxin ParE1/3/4